MKNYRTNTRTLPRAYVRPGFGSLAPRQSCTGAQLLVLLESFVSLLVVSTIGG